MSPPIVADTGGLLRGLASTRDGKPSFPEYEKILTSASLVIVPGLVLAEVDYFLRENRVAMRKLVAEIFDPATRYENELTLPSDMVRAIELRREPTGTQGTSGLPIFPAEYGRSVVCQRAFAARHHRA